MALSRMSQILNRAAGKLVFLPTRLLPISAQARELEKFDDLLIIESSTPKGMLRFAARTPLLIQRACTVLEKEPDTIAWIDGFKDTDVFWDIGANVGAFGLYAALAPQSKVLAFEPSASNYEVLCQNIHLNHFDRNMRAFCIAFSGDTRLGVLNLASNQVGGSMNEFGDVGNASRYCENPKNVIQQGMVGYTIDEFISRFSPDFPNHIKIDVDGLEYPILTGAVNTLRDSRLKSLLVELNLTNKPEYAAATKLLSDAGMKLVSKGLLQSAANQQGANHIFVKAT